MARQSYKVILFYKFANIKNPEKLRVQQLKIAQHFNLKGRMLIAKEGVNATFEGLSKDIDNYKMAFRAQKQFKDIVFKESRGDGKGFTKLKVKVRSEIVTLGIGDLNIKKYTAPAISAAELDRMYQKEEDFVVLDLRNDFEVNIGYFDKTVNPKLRNFRDLPQKISMLSKFKNKKVVAVCTGGIRCEKATVLLKKEGFSNLYQLKDGIHAYIKKFPGKHFRGSLFVFDNRMATQVVAQKIREVVGECNYCGVKSENFYNDDSLRPSKKVLCCDVCILKHKKLRPAVLV